MKIVLLGYMACGKSVIGNVLAAHLKLPFVDLDDYIETKEQRSIKTIFEDKGEIYFRKIEHRYLKEILENDTKIVLSLGGGAPCYSGNMEVINSFSATSIYLKASIPTLQERLIKEKNARPLIASLENHQLPEFIAKHLFERRFYYEKAIHKVSIDTKDILTIVNEIKTILL